VENSIPEFDTCLSVKADEITWHRPRPSYSPAAGPLTYDQLCTLTECEGVVETLTLTEIAAWICDLIREREEVKVSMHACMDALQTTTQRLNALTRLRRAA
jgi:hypothetical protein